VKETLIVPDWPSPPKVRALQTTRRGGISLPPFDEFNLGEHVGDNLQSVMHNRKLLRNFVPAEPFWLRQVHGIRAVDAALAHLLPEADAGVAFRAGVVCAVMTADCLPVLLCDQAGTVVGAVHAGWRGLAAGVIEASVRAMQVPPETLMAWLGPAIGPQAFEVGSDVHAAYVGGSAVAEQAFRPAGSGKWLADIYLLARQRLNALGITRIHGGGYCTYSDRERFFSFRRDGQTGRMATLIWLE
jgi:YfiH family protein